MFDFLKKPTHHHPLPQKNKEIPLNQFKSQSLSQIQQSLNASIISLQNHVQVKGKKKQTRVKKYRQPNPLNLNPEVKQQLQQFLLDSQNKLSNVSLNELINEQMLTRQKRVFTRYTASSKQDYLHKLIDKNVLRNNFVKNSLNDLIFDTVNVIADDIENNRNNYAVYKKKILTKQQIQQAQKSNQIHSIKIKEGQISSKVSQLKIEFNIINDQNVIAKAKSIIQKDNFDQDNQKNKNAEKFIQVKKIEKEQLQKKKKQQQEKKKLKEIQQKALSQRQAQKAKEQRHAKLLLQFETKQFQKKKKKQQIESQKQTFAKFLRQYKKAKPLYQQKIQDQIKRQIDQKKLRFKKMQQRKVKYNPINFQQLYQFELKYIQLKHQFEQKKNIEMAIKKDQERLRSQEIRDKHYKGKYRYLILQQMVSKEAQAKEQEFQKKLLAEKKKAYSVDIKEKCKPKIDENKRIQSLKFIAQDNRKNKQKGPRRVSIDTSDPNNFNTISYEVQEQQNPDPKKEGQKYRRLFKQYIHDKIQKGQIKRPQTFQSQLSVPTPKIDYLKQQRSNRQTRNSSFSYQPIDAESRIKKIKSQANGDVSLFKLKAQQFDEKVRRQQLKLKYTQHNPNDEKQLEQNYLMSIKAKLQLLNNVK